MVYQVGLRKYQKNYIVPKTHFWVKNTEYQMKTNPISPKLSSIGAVWYSAFWIRNVFSKTSRVFPKTPRSNLQNPFWKTNETGVLQFSILTKTNLGQFYIVGQQRKVKQIEINCTKAYDSLSTQEIVFGTSNLVFESDLQR